MIPNTDITNPTFKRLAEYATATFGFNIVYKDTSVFMKLLGLLFKPFNPLFMTEFTTTIGTTMYVPREIFQKHQDDFIEILAHEMVHMRESKSNGIVLYALRYLFPQILAVLALFAIGAIWSPWFLFALVFLVCLAPLPSPGRRDIELNGYTMSLAVRYWRSKQLLQGDFDWCTSEFTGSLYYYTWPWKNSIMNELKTRAIRIRTSDVLADWLFREVYMIVTKP